MVNIVKKKIQCGYSLNKSILYLFPLLVWNNSGKRIKWENFFSPLMIIVNCKGDSMFNKSSVNRMLFGFKVFIRKSGKFLDLKVRASHVPMTKSPHRHMIFLNWCI